MQKKIITVFLMLALLISIACGTVAFASVSLEECDRCFQTTISELVDSDEIENGKLNAVRKPLYDLKLQQLGYVYEFKLLSGNGYAVIICDDGNYVAQEFVKNSQSPYACVEETELCVYVNGMIYLKYCDGAYYEIETLTQISEETLDILSENSIIYKEGDGLNYKSESVTINYQTRVPNAQNLSLRIPHYASPGGLEGPCAAVAGANLIGFYDRYYEDLIPNHTAGIEAYGSYLYNLADEYVYDTIRDLYKKMDGSAIGITEAKFKEGMQEYCKEKNLTCDFTQLLSSGKLNYDAVKQSIAENKPVALLLSTYNICGISGYDDSKYDRYDYRLYSGNHVMAGFGYCELSYTFTNGSKQTNKFIYVATGFAFKSEAYFNVNYSTNINSAYKVFIH